MGLFYWDSRGRIKFNRDDTHPRFALGYRMMSLEIDSDLASLPGGATDLAVVGALEVGQVADGWTLYVVGGAGAATDNHFSDSDAYYGVGVVHVKHEIDPTSSLHLGLSYHGNRSIWQDVPLPYVTYQNYVDETFAFNMGVPVSSVMFRPIEPLTIDLHYTVPTNIGAKVAYAINEAWSLFGEYKRTIDGFVVHYRDDRRLFYELNRIAAGVRWQSRWIDASVGVGYAFGQEFSLGWDLRDTDTVDDLSDEPFLFFKLQGTF